MDPEIHTQDIIVLEDNLFPTRIWSPMGSYIVQAEPSGKPHTGFESISSPKTLVTNQCANTILNLISKVVQGNAGLCDGLHVVANLAMGFSSFAVVIEEFIIHVVHNG